MTPAQLVTAEIADAQDVAHTIDTEDIHQYAADLRRAWNALVERLKVVDGGDPNCPQVPPPPPPQ